MYRKRIIQALTVIMLCAVLIIIGYKDNEVKNSHLYENENDSFSLVSDTMGILDITYKGNDFGVLLVSNTSKIKSNKYKYILTPLETQRIALTDGVGTYKIENYSVIRTSDFSEKIDFHGQDFDYTYQNDDTECINIFLESTSIVNYLENEDMINKTFENTDNIDEIFFYFSNFEYDYDLANNITNGNLLIHKVNISKTIENKKGICLDIATSMVAVLRSKGYPTQLVYGYVDSKNYHSWIRVYINNEWISYDPTLYKSGKLDNLSNYTITEYH